MCKITRNLSESIAPMFDPKKQGGYKAGEVITFKGMRYEAKQDIAEGTPFKPEQWEAKSIQQVLEEGGGGGGGKFIVVDELPDAATADPMAIYLVPKASAQTQNIYDEYVRVEPTEGTYAWEKIGDTEIDLSGYATKSDVTLTPVYSSPAGATWSITYPQGWTYGTVSVDPWDGSIWKMDLDSSGETFGASDDINAASFTGIYEGLTVVATRTDSADSYRLGPNDGPNADKPLATAEQGAKADTAIQPVAGATAGHFAGLDANGGLTDSGKGASDFMAADAKIQRIYNAAGTDALDDKGQLFMPGLTGNYFEYNGTTYSYHGYESGIAGNFYTYYNPTATRWICYNKGSGYVFEAPVNMLVAAAYTIAADLNPLNGDDLSPTTSGTGFTFHKREQSPASVLYAKFAIESLPDATIAASTSYVVGSLVKDTTTNKAYRCKAMYTTGPSPTAPSSDSTHWTEIPVLAQKMNSGTHIKELYNSSETVKCDGDGQVFVSSQSGNFWVVDNDETYIYNGFYNGLDHWKHDDWNEIRYNRSTGEITEMYNDGTWNIRSRGTVTSDLNPTLGDKIPSLPTVGFRYGTGAIFTELATHFPQSPNDYLVRVSDLAAFDSTKSYSVGDIVGYQGMVYKCTTAHTGAWDVSHFTLASKAEVQAYLAVVGAGGGGGTPLAGNTYDFSLNADIVKAVADVARALGATVNNDPTESSES